MAGSGAGTLCFARWVLALSAAPFAAVGLAFLVSPVGMGSLVGLSLADATAHADVRAVYGGLQLGCALFLAMAAANRSWCRAGLAGQLALYAGLALARFLSYAEVGLPTPLGFVLHAGELGALVIGIVAWRTLPASRFEPHS